MFPELQEKYLADPKSGPCPCFKPGDTFVLDRTPEKDDFYHLMNGRFCGEAWDAVSRYVYTALQGGSIMHGWTNDERMMITCCNDGTRPVIFKIERIDIPENEEEKEWLQAYSAKHPDCKVNLTNAANLCFPAIDILPNLQAVRCFGMSDFLKVSIEEFDSVGDLRRFFMNEIDSVAVKLAADKACRDCYGRRTGYCYAGCLGFKASRIKACNEAIDRL